MNNELLKTSLLTCLALIAFAANSVLCRMALGNESIDAASFTGIRMLSGAAALMLILAIKGRSQVAISKGSWSGSVVLFLYALTFSYAYLSLDTGTGALILFGAVQITIVLLTIFSGGRLHISEWLGVVIAFGGFIYLVLPSVTTPSLTGFILMTVSGVSWGIYTLQGRDSLNPLMDTAYNFLRAIPFVALLTVFTIQGGHFSVQGIIFAVLSGALTSGIGYTIWYIALAGLTATQAAVIQLSVPILAAIGGVLFVFEEITSRLIISAIIVLGGILMVILGRHYFVREAEKITTK